MVEAKLEKFCMLANHLFEAITSGIVFVDAKTMLVDNVNPAALILFGIRKEDIIGKPCKQFICDSEFFDVDNQEEIIERKDGSELVVLKTITSFLFDNRKYLLINLVDITECKRSEMLACENEQRFEDIIYSMADWVWEINVDGIYIYCSEKVKDILGYAVDEVLGKSPFDFMESEEAERVKRIYFNILKSGGNIVNLENWNIKKNGELVCLLTNGLPMFDIDGDIKGYRGVDKDITKQKLIWDKLEKKLIDNINIIKNDNHIDYSNIESIQNLYKALGLLELEANKIEAV